MLKREGAESGPHSMAVFPATTRRLPRPGEALVAVLIGPDQSFAFQDMNSPMQKT